MLGKQIKALRLHYHLTQKEMADSLGLSRSTLAGYETEHKQPSHEVLINIAKTYHTSTDFLLGLSNMIAIDSIPFPELSPEDEEVLLYYRKLGKIDRQWIIGQMLDSIRNAEKNG